MDSLIPARLAVEFFSGLRLVENIEGGKPFLRFLGEQKKEKQAGRTILFYFGGFDSLLYINTNPSWFCFMVS